MKAVLVLDEMPCACAECPLHTHVSFDYYFDEHICMANGNKILYTKEVHRLCPLKKIPTLTDEEREYIDESWVKGFDWVIEEIEK